jgi:integrase
MAKITRDVVDRLQPGQIEWDSDVKGFYVRCQLKAKTYGLKARYRGRPVWLGIGDVGTWTPKLARDEVSRLKRELRAGVGPDKLRSSARGQPTIGELIDRVIAEHIDVHLKPSTVGTVKWLLRTKIAPAWSKRLVVDVTSDDVAKLHHKLRNTPRQANQTIAIASKMFSLAEEWHLRPQNSNPCRRLRKFKEVIRTRFFDDDELRAIALAITELESEDAILPGCAALIRLAPMTGCRLSELLNLQWADVDLQAGALEIRDAKAGARRHPIGGAVVAFLAGLERVGPWVCQGVVPDRHLSTSCAHTAWAAVRERAGLQDARFHDLRHSYGTFAGSTGANTFLVRDALGHRTLAMSSRYVGRDADPMRQLVDTVASRVAGAMSGSTAKVLPIRKDGAA